MWLSISVKSDDEKQLMYSNPMTPNTPSYNLLQLILPAVLHPFLFFLTSHSPPGPRWWIICEILAGSLSRVDLKGDGDTNENDIYISGLQREPLSSHWSWFTKTFETVHTPDEQRLKMSNNKKKIMAKIRHLDHQRSVPLLSCCQELSVHLTHWEGRENEDFLLLTSHISLAKNPQIQFMYIF